MENIKPIEEPKFHFSNVEDNDNFESSNSMEGRKNIKVTKEDSDVARITFNLDNDSIFVKTLVSTERGKKIGVKLYEELIKYGKENNFENIFSNQTVQSGAIATWNNLQDLGYDITINPEIKEKYINFIQKYKNGEKETDFKKGHLSSSDNTPIFTLKLKSNQ